MLTLTLAPTFADDFCFRNTSPPNDNPRSILTRPNHTLPNNVLGNVIPSLYNMKPYAQRGARLTTAFAARKSRRNNWADSRIRAENFGAKN